MRLRRGWVATAALVAVAAVAIAPPVGGAADGETATATASKAKRVNIKGFAYKPKTLRVKRGTRVTFKNLDSARHNAVSRGRFTTGTLRRGKAATVRFKKRGTYRFICTFHPFMKGKVVVR